MKCLLGPSVNSMNILFGAIYSIEVGLLDSRGRSQPQNKAMLD